MTSCLMVGLLVAASAACGGSPEAIRAGTAARRAPGEIASLADTARDLPPLPVAPSASALPM